MADEHAQVLIELAHAIGAWASGDQETFVSIVRTLHTRYVERPTLPGIPGPAIDSSKASAHRDAAMRIFLYWQQRCDKPRARPVAARIDHVVRRLREGYREVEIKRAIDGAAIDPYVKDGVRYDDLELICRDGAKLEAFLARAEKSLGPIVVDEGPGAPIEEIITTARRRAADLKRAGRATEYQAALNELERLLAERKEA
jgi:hypothetical protein